MVPFSINTFSIPTINVQPKMATSLESEKYHVSHDSIMADSTHNSVQITGDGGEYVILGGKKYFRHELMQAFGGTLNSERYSPYPKHQFANAGALGLASFALTTFVLGLYLSGAMGIETPNVVVGLCFWYGGLVEAFAGIWELVLGNCFAGTVFVSFGMGFWISYGAIFVEAFGIPQSYGDDTEMWGNAVGFFLTGWGIFCFLMLLCTLKSTLVFVGLFVSLDIAFFVLAGYYYTTMRHSALLKVGGICCVISASCGWYLAYAGVASKQNTYVIPRDVLLPIIGSSR